MTKLSFDTDKKELKSVVDQISKQYITVGDYLQKYLLAKKQEEGKEVKTIREYMDSQRGYVWEAWRASNLIQSILLRISIPEITVYRADGKSQFRKVLDGQQRLTSIYMFVNNEIKFDLSKSIFPEWEIEGQMYTATELQGKTFSELPELFQDIINSYDLRITTINNCSEEMAEKFFVSMNAGVKTLKAAEIRKAAMGIGTRRLFRQILNSDWVLHALTTSAITGNVGDEILSQCVTLLQHNKPVELSKGNIDDVIYNLRDSGLPETMRTNLMEVCDYLNQATAIWIENKKIADASQENKKGKKVSNYATYRFAWLDKTAVTMLIYATHKAIFEGIAISTFATWAFDFFQNPSEQYKEGLRDKVIDFKRVELRLQAINAEIGKLPKGENENFSEVPEVIEQVKEEIVAKISDNATQEKIKTQKSFEMGTYEKELVESINESSVTSELISRYTA